MIKENSVISVFGMGHIGLPTAALFAKNGLNTIGVELNGDMVKIINDGSSPILEPGLEELVSSVIESGNLIATKDGVDASKASKVMIIVVPTPKDGANNSELSAVKAASETISKGLKKENLVIVESTVPPKTCEDLVIPILEKSGLKAGKDFGMAYTPERALPNNTIYEMTHNDRIIGGIDQKSVDRAADLYSRITSGEIIKVKNLVTAEMVKLMENTFRDANIALANEFALVCETLGINAMEAIEAANHHPRVNIHTPGPGVGGHCLSIDPYFIVETAEKRGFNAPLIKTARDINNSMPLHVAELVVKSLEEVGKTVKNSKIGILGVAYKGNVADARETPAKLLIETLNQKGAKVLIHDPYVSPEMMKSLKGQPASFEEVLESDCVVLLTDHDMYKKITPEMIKKGVLVCTRPILDPYKFRENGILFRGVGV
jgi:UDP-N-acetyl-D-mannosaminuronic acid dehydrogenase